MSIPPEGGDCAGGGPSEGRFCCEPQAGSVVLDTDLIAARLAFRVLETVGFRPFEGYPPPPDLLNSGTYMGEVAKIISCKELIGKIFRTKHLASEPPLLGDTPSEVRIPNSVDWCIGRASR